ncbi:hypothetical protein ACLOJK_037360 [Asimina triloba]
MRTPFYNAPPEHHNTVLHLPHVAAGDGFTGERPIARSNPTIFFILPGRVQICKRLATMGRETHLIRQRPFQRLTQSSHGRKSDPDQGVRHRPWPILAPNASMPASELACSVQSWPISTAPPSGRHPSAAMAAVRNPSEPW